MEVVRLVEHDTITKHNVTYYRIEMLPAHPLYVKSGNNLGGYICKDSKIEDGGWISEGVFLTRSTVKDAAVLINSSVIGYKIDVIDSEISGSTSLNWEVNNSGAIIKNSEISGLESGNTSLKLVNNSRVIGAWRCSNEYGIEIVDSVIIGSGTVGGKLNGVWKN
jgi:hypothetical protein